MAAVVLLCLFLSDAVNFVVFQVKVLYNTVVEACQSGITMLVFCESCDGVVFCGMKGSVLFWDKFRVTLLRM